MGERVYEVTATIFVEADSEDAANGAFWDAVDAIADGGSSTVTAIQEDRASSADTGEEG